MKRILAVCIAALLALTPALAQNSIFWEVTGNGIKKPSYLLDTLKFIGKREFFLPRMAIERMDQCEAFINEDQVDHRSQHELNKTLHLPDGKKIADYLTPDEYNRLLALFDSEFKINRAQFEKQYGAFIPLALSITMTRLSLGEKVKFYDIELLKIAKRKELETFTLETIEREAQAIQSYPLADQVKALNHSIADFATQKREYLELKVAFIKGDIDLVFVKTLHPTENNPQFIESYYYQRNEEWLPKIEKIMSEQPTFIAVGAGHLEGERGLVRLLQKKGYQLKPLLVFSTNTARE